MKYRRFLIGTIAATMVAANAQAQLTTNSAVSPQDLVDALVGAGPNSPTISNIVFQGAPTARGTFSGGTGIIGFESGIIISTGNIANVQTANGLNNSNATTTNFGQPGDPDLNAILPPNQQTFDRAFLQFDFECDNLQVLSFQYVFASEEYNEYANTGFNDVFAFFVNGVNVALLPDNVTVVSINNVNCGNPVGDPTPHNCAFYINNSCQGPPGDPIVPFPCAPPRATEMDGMTVVLNVFTTINPGVNTIKIAIADVGDSAYDSAVFIRSGSFTCAPPSSACCLPDGTCVEVSEADCSDLGGVFNADMTCADVSCPLPTAACCLPDGTCVEVFEEDCDVLGGVFNAGMTCDDVTCPDPGQCVYSQGYWSNHPGAWPVNMLMLGNVAYTQQQLLAILGQPVRRNGLVLLAYQLIAAKLNAANGAAVPPGVQAAINAADVLIGDLVCPPFGGGNLHPSAVSALASMLDAYNTGQAPDGPAHCD